MPGWILEFKYKLYCFRFVVGSGNRIDIFNIEDITRIFNQITSRLGRESKYSPCIADNRLPYFKYVLYVGKVKFVVDSILYK